MGRKRRRKAVGMTGRLLGRIFFNLLVGGIILGLVTALFSLFENTGAIIGSIVALIFLVFAVPMILKLRPGKETLLSFFLAIPIGATLLVLVNAILGNFGIALPLLAFGALSGEIPTTYLGLVLAFTSYFGADWIYTSIFRRR